MLVPFSVCLVSWGCLRVNDCTESSIFWSHLCFARETTRAVFFAWESSFLRWKIYAFCDITKSNLWYHKINLNFWYHKVEFVISQNKREFDGDITNSILWYHKISLNLWYHKIEFVISQIQTYFVIAQIRFCDITNSILWYHKIEFMISKMLIL